jgi:hypothetical protein
MHARQNWHDALDTQASLHRFYQGEHGKRFMLGAYQTEGDGLRPEVQQLLQMLIASEAMFVGRSTPYFVSREMCEVVEAAYPSFKPEPIYPTDFLTLEGFLLFERPFQVPDRFDRPVEIQGFSWRPVMSGDDVDAAKSRLYGREDEIREWIEFEMAAGRPAGVAMTIYQPATNRAALPGAPAIVPLHFTPWYWSMTFEGNEVDERGVPTAAEWWWRVLQSTLRLMQQTISTRYKLKAPRASRREARRLGLLVDETVVVRLRREKQPLDHGHTPEPAHYSHRFIVGAPDGFWRNQWYPSEKVHRQIWIAPFVKGDESLPLVIKPRAYSWNR